MDHYKNLKLHYLYVWCFCWPMLFNSCAIQREEFCEWKGIYCTSESRKEFNYYIIVNIEQSDIAIEEIYPTVGQITYYKEGRITQRTNRKIRIEFAPQTSYDLRKWYIYDLEGHFHIKILPNNEIILVGRNHGKRTMNRLSMERCNCISNQVESLILGTRKIPTNF